MKAHLAESTSQDQNIYVASAHLQQESLSGCQHQGKIITVGWVALAYIVKLTEMTVFFSFISILLCSPKGRSMTATPACYLFSSNSPPRARTEGQQGAIPACGPRGISASLPAGPEQSLTINLSNTSPLAPSHPDNCL